MWLSIFTCLEDHFSECQFRRPSVWHTPTRGLMGLSLQRDSHSVLWSIGSSYRQMNTPHGELFCCKDRCIYRWEVRCALLLKPTAWLELVLSLAQSGNLYIASRPGICSNKATKDRCSLACESPGLPMFVFSIKQYTRFHGLMPLCCSSSLLFLSFCSYFQSLCEYTSLCETATHMKSEHKVPWTSSTSCCLSRTVNAEKNYIYQNIGEGNNDQNSYILFCWSVPDPN